MRPPALEPPTALFDGGAEKLRIYLLLPVLSGSKCFPDFFRLHISSFPSLLHRANFSMANASKLLKCVFVLASRPYFGCRWSWPYPPHLPRRNLVLSPLLITPP